MTKRVTKINKLDREIIKQTNALVFACDKLLGLLENSEKASLDACLTASGALQGMGEEVQRRWPAIAPIIEAKFPKREEKRIILPSHPEIVS